MSTNFKEVTVSLMASTTASGSSNDGPGFSFKSVSDVFMGQKRVESNVEIPEPLNKLPRLDENSPCNSPSPMRDNTEIPLLNNFTETCDEVMASLYSNNLTSTLQLLSEFEALDTGSIQQCEYENSIESEHEHNDIDESSLGDEFYDVEETLTADVMEHLTQASIGDKTSQSESFAESVNNDKMLLYPSAKITVGCAMVLLMLFAMKYNLAGGAIQHMLSLLSLFLPPGNGLCSTLNSFKRYFFNLRNPLTFHYYCSFCLTHIKNKDREKICPNTGCIKDLTVKGALSYFVEIPVVHQLRTFFSRPSFYNDIQHRFNRKTQKDIISDIYDGAIYKELCEKGILNCKDNISFIANTDGVPVFKSSKVSIWPVYMIINELPYKKRMAKENMLFCGIWFGEKKPAMWTFLKPFCQTFRELEKGVEIESPTRGKFKCKGVVIAWTTDLPARCLVCNSMQFNGEYGCWKCLQKGKTVPAGGGHVQAFPFQSENPKGPPRDRNGIIKDARDLIRKQIAGEKITNVNGVKGPSYLSTLEHYDTVRGIAIDYMHGVLLGVQKLLLKLWFSTSFSGKPYNFCSFCHKLDERLEKISPTLDITRLPRSVSEHMKYWKANELRSFLLFYGIPCLYGLLPDLYFNHYALFAHAIYILLKDKITKVELFKAEQLLQRFCALFADIYEPRFMTLNIHQLLHFVDDVRELGPLYTHSCFPFEDKNGFIIKQINGTQFIDSQIMYAVALTQKIPELKQSCISPGSEEEELYFDLSYPQKPKRGMKISDGVFILGTPFRKTLTDDEFRALETFLGHAPRTVEVTAFNRIEHHLSYIYGTSYKRMTRRNCSTVKYWDGLTPSFGQITYFVQLQENGIKVYLALVQPLPCIGYSPSTHIHVVNRGDQVENSLVAINVSSICANCIYISFPCETTRSYVCEFPNKLEME